MEGQRVNCRFSKKNKRLGWVGRQPFAEISSGACPNIGYWKLLPSCCCIEFGFSAVSSLQFYRKHFFFRIPMATGRSEYLCSGRLVTAFQCENGVCIAKMGTKIQYKSSIILLVRIQYLKLDSEFAAEWTPIAKCHEGKHQRKKKSGF